jgi:hypothetical protein
MSPAKNQDSGTRQERARLLAAKAKQMDPVVEEEKEDKVTRFSASYVMPYSRLNS